MNVRKTAHKKWRHLGRTSLHKVAQAAFSVGFILFAVGGSMMDSPSIKIPTLLTISGMVIMYVSYSFVEVPEDDRA